MTEAPMTYEKMGRMIGELPATHEGNLLKSVATQGKTLLMGTSWTREDRKKAETLHLECETRITDLSRNKSGKSKERKNAIKLLQEIAGRLKARLEESGASVPTPPSIASPDPDEGHTTFPGLGPVPTAPAEPEPTTVNDNGLHPDTTPANDVAPIQATNPEPAPSVSSHPTLTGGGLGGPIDPEFADNARILELTSKAIDNWSPEDVTDGKRLILDEAGNLRTDRRLLQTMTMDAMTYQDRRASTAPMVTPSTDEESLPLEPEPNIATSNPAASPASIEPPTNELSTTELEVRDRLLAMEISRWSWPHDYEVAYNLCWVQMPCPEGSDPESTVRARRPNTRDIHDRYNQAAIYREQRLSQLASEALTPFFQDEQHREMEHLLGVNHPTFLNKVGMSAGAITAWQRWMAETLITIDQAGKTWAHDDFEWCRQNVALMPRATEQRLRAAWRKQLRPLQRNTDIINMTSTEGAVPTITAQKFVDQERPSTPPPQQEVRREPSKPRSRDSMDEALPQRIVPSSSQNPLLIVSVGILIVGTAVACLAFGLQNWLARSTTEVATIPTSPAQPTPSPVVTPLVPARPAPMPPAPVRPAPVPQVVEIERPLRPTDLGNPQLDLTHVPSFGRGAIPPAILYGGNIVCAQPPPRNADFTVDYSRCKWRAQAPNQSNAIPPTIAPVAPAAAPTKPAAAPSPELPDTVI